MKNLLLYLCFIIIVLVSSTKTLTAQTTLVAGDIAFSGVIGRGASPATDAFSIVLLNAVSQNTSIRFTDYGWRTNSNSFNSGGASTETEAVLLITNPAGYPAGTEIKIENLSATLVGGGSAGTLTFTTGTAPDGSTFTSPFSLNGINGDQVLIYQGTMASPTFIAGLHWNRYTIAGGDPTNSDATNWDGVVSGIYINANTSSKPTTLAVGSSSLWMQSTTDMADPEKGNGYFPCGPDVSTISLARTALFNNANWTTNDTNEPVGFTLPTGCNYVGYLSSPPSITTNPSNSTICEGTNTSFTIVATGASSYQWQVNNGGGFANVSNNATYSGATTTTLNITSATNAMNGYLYRCVATNGSGSTNSNNGTLTVVPIPINPTLSLKTPAAVSVADGTPVSATFNAGSGGTGCSDDYRYTTNGGASYLPYTPGANISTTGLAASSGFVFIEGRRAGCSSLCQNGYIVLAAWYVTPLPAGATTLNAGDIAFSGYTSTTGDDFSFVLLKNIGAGTVINFTDNGWNSTTSTLQSGEQTITWTSNAAYPGGTEIIISGLTATLAVGGSAGTVTGTALSLTTSGDQILAYRGASGSPTFISGIHMNVYSTTNGDAVSTTTAAWDGAGTANVFSNCALPPGLTTGTNAIWIGTLNVPASEFNNARYGDCSFAGTFGPNNTLRSALNNQTNWIKNSDTPPGFILPTGCLYFGLGAVPTITLNPTPSTVCDGISTSFSITAGGALTYQWQVDNGGGFTNLTNNTTYTGVNSTTLNINATPFSLNGYLYRCVASNVSGSTPSSSALLTVNAVPVGPTLLTKTPGANNVADGTPISATFNVGSGGTGCSDNFRYTTDGGSTYLPYTPGNNISTTGIAAGSGWVFIEGRRAGCSSVCQGEYKVLASWYVFPTPVVATTLNAGDIAFSSYSAAVDEFSFVLLRNIGPGTVINFTNTGWLPTNVFRTPAEETVTWTAPAGGLTGGVEIKIAGLVATRSGGGAAGTVTGTGLTLNISGDQILAYRGTPAAPTFISAIHMNVYTVANGDPTTTTAAAWDGNAYSASTNSNPSSLPTGLTTGVNAIWIGTQDILNSEFDNAAYGSCAGPGVLGPLTGLRSALNNQGNWVRNNDPSPGFTIPTGCNYLSALAPTINVTGTPLAAFTSCAGTVSAEQNFVAFGTNLTANITINSPTGFEISTTSGSGFGSSLTLTQSGGSVPNTTIYVRLTNSASGTPSGNITLASTGVTTINVAVSGTVNVLPTTANAGPDQNVCGISATLAGNTPTIGTGAWSIISGAGGSVTTPSSPGSAFTGVAGTSYTLRWTITNAPCTPSTEDVVISLTANPTLSNAGPDQSTCGTSTTLAGNAPTIGTGAWSIISGAGGSVTTPGSPTSDFTGVAGTTYTLRWTISNAPCVANEDDTDITFNLNNTIALSSAPNTNIQTAVLNNPIQNITYNTTGATGATFSGLPPGVMGVWSGNMVTISGSPNSNAMSPYNYTVTLTGGCGSVTAMGTITVIVGVAQIMGGSGYNTLQQALDASVDGDEIMLLQNIAESDLVVTNSVKLNAGAYTLTASGLTIPSGKYLRWLTNTLTIPATFSITNLGTLWNNGTITHIDPYSNAGTYKGTGTFNGNFTNNGLFSSGN